MVIDYSMANKKCKTGRFQWGGVNYSHTSHDLHLEGHRLVGTLATKAGGALGVRHGRLINLDERIVIGIDGMLRYLP